MRCYQINYQQTLGGGEIYTSFLTRALLYLGWEVTLFVHPKAGFWGNLISPNVKIIAASSSGEILRHLQRSPRGLILANSPDWGKLLSTLREAHMLAAIAHMPENGTKGKGYLLFDVVFAVSKYVLCSLQNIGITNYYPYPLYGVADFDRPGAQNNETVRSNSLYNWDTRKFRDRLLGYLEPLYLPLTIRQIYSKKPGITLGIVSRITPIKQFPLMFEILSPVIKQFPDVHLEIFGSGGYASVRDLKHKLKQIRHQVRFWGQQNNVRQIYSMLDYVMTGLPEREALGLNVIEAQACGTPVIGVNAPPFTETILDGETGFLYCDPRQDNGADFKSLLEKITQGKPRPNPLLKVEHLARFSQTAFIERVSAALEYIMTKASQQHD